MHFWNMKLDTFISVMHLNPTWVWKSGALHNEHVQYILWLFLTSISVIKLFQNAWVPLELSGSVILICCLFSNSSFVIGILGIKLSWFQTVWGYVIVGSYLVERGNGSRGVAAEAIASLDCGDGALEVGAVQQLGELQQSVAQDEQLGHTDSTVALQCPGIMKVTTDILACKKINKGRTEMYNFNRFSWTLNCLTAASYSWVYIKYVWCHRNPADLWATEMLAVF